MKKIIVILLAIFVSIPNFYCLCQAFMIQQRIKKNGTDRSISNIKVINIIVDKIDNKYIYAKDGRRFVISLRTKIIDNSGHEQSNIRIAKLIFQNYQLIMVILK